MAAKKLPVYELEISEEEMDKSGVQYVALVDNPAVEMDWQKFENQKPMYFVSDQSRRIVTGVAMRADFPIYRNNPAKGEHYVVFKKDTIEKIMKKRAKQGYQNNFNLMHNPEAITEGVYELESFMVDSQRGILAPKGMKVEDGSWIMSVYIENDEVWNEVQSGAFRGLSVEGFFGYEFGEQVNVNDCIAEIQSILNSL